MLQVKPPNRARGLSNERLDERLLKDANRAARRRDLLIGRGRPLAEAESIVRRFSEELPAATRDFVQRSGRRARLAQTLTAAAAVVFAGVALAAAVDVLIMALPHENTRGKIADARCSWPGQPLQRLDQILGLIIWG